jgi:hypothetical protein
MAHLRFTVFTGNVTGGESIKLQVVDLTRTTTVKGTSKMSSNTSFYSSFGPTYLRRLFDYIFRYHDPSHVVTVYDDTHRGTRYTDAAIMSMADYPHLVGYLEYHSPDTDGSFAICLAGGVGVFVTKVRLLKKPLLLYLFSSSNVGSRLSSNQFQLNIDPNSTQLMQASPSIARRLSDLHSSHSSSPTQRPANESNLYSTPSSYPNCIWACSSDVL